MNVMYNSDNYYVVEFPGRHGIELVDKTMGRAGFLEGAVEVKFRASMAHLAAGDFQRHMIEHRAIAEGDSDLIRGEHEHLQWIGQLSMRYQ